MSGRALAGAAYAAAHHRIPTSSPASALTIAVINQKGGTGRTTTAVNLAAGLARAGRRVLLADLDPQSHATYGLGIDFDALDAAAPTIEGTNAPKPLKKPDGGG